MSHGQIGKAAAGDMAADLVIRKLLDFLAVNQPQLWERIRQIVTPRLNVAQGGMIAGAEVLALLKDNLSFLPSWAHQILDAGLAQAPMSITSYFRTHQARAEVLDRVGHVLDGLTPEKLGQEIEQAMISSPEFRQMAEDATLGRMMRNMQAYQEAVVKALNSDFRMTIVSSFKQAFDARNPDPSDADNVMVATFGFWFLRQSEAVSIVVSHVLATQSPLTDPLDLLSREGLRRFVDLDDQERLAMMRAIGQRFNTVVPLTTTSPAMFSADESADPVERYQNRQRSYSAQAEQSFADDMAKLSGSAEEIGRLYRAAYEAVNGPFTPEQAELNRQFITRLEPLNLRRRRMLQCTMQVGYDTFVTKTAKAKPAEEEKMRTKLYTPNVVAEMAVVTQAELEAAADQFMATMEVAKLMLGHVMGALAGSLEAMAGIDDKRRRQ